VCLRSWNQVLGKFAFFKVRSKYLFSKLLCSIGLPASLGNTRASSLAGQASFHFFSSVIRVSPRSILRFEFFVFVGKNHPLLKVLWIWIWLLSQSISPHLRPNSSPWRASLKIANMKRIRYFWLSTLFSLMPYLSRPFQCKQVGLLWLTVWESFPTLGGPGLSVPQRKCASAERWTRKF